MSNDTLRYDVRWQCDTCGRAMRIGSVEHISHACAQPKPSPSDRFTPIINPTSRFEDDALTGGWNHWGAFQRLEYILAYTHYSLESGADAHVALFKLLPLLITEHAALEKSLLDRDTKLKAAREALEWYANVKHYDEDGRPGKAVLRDHPGMDGPEYDFDCDEGSRARKSLALLGGDDGVKNDR